MTDEEMAEKYAKANMHYEIAKRENGADYAKEVSNVTIKQAFLAGLEYKNKENAELKEKISILLSCKNCPENKGGWICAKEYENKCLAQKIEFIKEFEKEKCELLGIVQGKDKVIQELEKENAELKANKQFLNNLVREKEQRGLEIQEDLLRENEKLKEQCLILADCNTCHSTCKNENIEIKKQSNL